MFTEVETGHRLEWTTILECLSVQYFDVLMVYVTRLYDYSSRNLGRNMQPSDWVSGLPLFILLFLFV